MDGVVVGAADWMGEFGVVAVEGGYEGAELGDLVRLSFSCCFPRCDLETTDKLDRATRFLGVQTANGVFVWRYLNVPENWAYVNSFWSWVLVIATMIPEFLYPFVFWRVHHQQMGREAEEARRRERKAR